MTSLGAVLEQYPDDVCMYVSDPRTGVQRTSKWPPTISEIVEACNARVADLKRRERYANWGKNEPVEEPQAPRPTLAQLKEKYGENWGIGEKESAKEWKYKAPDWAEIKAFYEANPERWANLVKPLEDGMK